MIDGAARRMDLYHNAVLRHATRGQVHLFGRRHPPPKPGLLVYRVDRVHLRDAAVERDPVRGLAPAVHVHERLELVPAYVTCVR